VGWSERTDVEPDAWSRSALDAIDKAVISGNTDNDGLPDPASALSPDSGRLRSAAPHKQPESRCASHRLACRRILQQEGHARGWVEV